MLSDIKAIAATHPRHGRPLLLRLTLHQVDRTTARGTRRRRRSDAGGLDREAAAFARTAEATLGAVDETAEILLTPLDRWPEADMRRLLSDPGYWGADRALRDGYRDRVALWHGQERFHPMPSRLRSVFRTPG